MHARARAGGIEGFTGINDPYERPERPELEVDMSTGSIETAVWHIIIYLRTDGGRDIPVG